MWINKLNIAAILLVVTCVSCRKEETTFEREKDLDKDTATLVFEAHYVSHTATELWFGIDMLTLNELESEKSYQGEHQFPTTNPSGEFAFDLTNVSVQQLQPINEYSTVVLLDLANPQFLNEEYVGVYLRRYFEIADSLPWANVAFSSYSPQDNHDTRFHAEDPSDIFGNSWEYNVKTYHELKQNLFLNGGSSVSMLFFKRRIMEAIDSLAAVNAPGENSITLISGTNDFNGGDQNDYLEIINKAVASNVNINVISQTDHANYHCLATGTGGFYSTRPIIEEQQPPEFYENLSFGSSVKTGLLNLDDLLRKNVTVHRHTVGVTSTNGGNFDSGAYFTTEFEYNGFIRHLRFIIP